MKTLEVVTANATGSVRYAKLNGRDHAVVNAVLLVPGVLAGSNGPLYYPPEELRRTVDAWNGVSIVAPSHPTDETGQNVSARSPEVQNKYGVGTVYNARIRPKDGALVGEAWLDVEAARQKYPQLLDAVKNGNKVELSTGLYTTNRPVQNGKCPRSGRDYHLEATKHRPDHLAILLSEQGACSLADGCGLGVNAKKEEKKPCCDACKTGKPCEGKGHDHEHADEKPTGNWCNQHGGTTCKGGAKAPAGGKPVVPAPAAKKPGKGSKRAALQAERDQHLAHAHDLLGGKLPATDEHLGKLAHGLSRLTAPQVKALREKFAGSKAGKGVKAAHVEAVKALALKKKPKAAAPAVDPKKTDVKHLPGVGTVYQDRPQPEKPKKKGLLHRFGRVIGRVAAALDVVGNERTELVVNAAYAALLDLAAAGDRATLKRLARYVRNAAPPDADALAAVSKELAGKGAMPGYGQVFLKPGGHVWYVGGDGDEFPEPNLPETLFRKVPGVTKVTVEAETFPPVAGGWERVYPAVTANCGGKGGKPGPCPTRTDAPAAGRTPLETEIRDKLSSPDRREYPYQAARRVDLPAEYKLLDMKHAPVCQGDSGSCHISAHKNALADPSHKLWTGVLVEKKDLADPNDPPDAFAHSWTVKDGKIHDATLGNKKGKNYHYLGEPVEVSRFKGDADLGQYTVDKLKASHLAANSSQEVPPDELAANLWSEAARAAAAVARRLRRRGKLALRNAGRTVYGRTIGSIVDDVKDAAREVRESRLVGVVRRDLAAVKKKAKLAKRFAEHKLRQVERGAESDASRRKGGVTPARVVGRPGPTLPVAKRASAKPPAPAGKTAVSADDVRTVDDLKRFMAAGGKVSVQGKPARPKPAPSAARRNRFSHNADGTLVLHANPAGCNQHTGPGCSGGGGGALDVALGLRLAARQATGRAFDASHAAMAHGTPHTLLRATEAARKLARRAQQGVGGAGGTPRHHSDASRAHRKAAEAHDAYREAKAATPEAKAAHLRAATAHREAAASHAAVAGHLEKEGPMTGTHRWDERVPVHNLAVDGRVVNCGGEGREARPLPVRQGVPGGRGGGPARGGRRVVGLTGNNFPGGTTVKRLNRAKVIAALTGNCDCWKGAEEVLNQMTDDQLRAVKGGADVEAAALVAYNAATGETQVTGRDLLAFVANAGKKPAETEAEAEEAEDRSPGKKMAGNSANPFEGLTDEQAFDVLPSSLKKLVANAKKVEDNRKAELVGRLTANCAKEKVEAAKVRFNAMDLDTLEDLAAALPVGNAKADEDDDNPFRTRPTANAGEDDEDGLFLNAARPANRLARFGPAEGDRTGTVVNAGKGVVTEDDGFDIRPLDEVIAANSVFDPTRALANGRPARK